MGLSGCEFYFFYYQQFTQSAVADHGSYFVTTSKRHRLHDEEETNERERQIEGKEDKLKRLYNENKREKRERKATPSSTWGNRKGTVIESKALGIALKNMTK